jgi:hypothetical protein
MLIPLLFQEKIKIFFNLFQNVQPILLFINFTIGFLFVLSATPPETNPALNYPFIYV